MYITSIVVLVNNLVYLCIFENNDDESSNLKKIPREDR